MEDDTDTGLDPYLVPKNSEPSAVDNSAADLVELVKAWERLRLRYNLICLPVGLIAGIIWVWQLIPWERTITGGITFGVTANFCFFLGPLIEVYVRGVLGRGRANPLLRSMLFGGGTFLTVVVIIFWGLLGLLNGIL